MNTLASYFKFLFSLLVLSTLHMGLVTTANATLIGDEVDAGIFSATGFRATGFGLDGPFMVETGSGDQQNYNDIFLLDVEGDGFSIDYITFAQGFTGGAEFRITDLNWVGMPNGFITGLVIEQNWNGWDDSFASFDDHSATFVFGSAGVFNPNTFFNVTFLTDHSQEPSSVPEPGTLALMGLGLAGIAATRRRRRVC